MSLNINNLPLEIISTIVSYVDPRTLPSLSRVNKLFFDVIENSTSVNVQNFFLRSFKCFNISYLTFIIHDEKLKCHCLNNESEIIKLFNKRSLQYCNKDFTNELLTAIRLNHSILALYLLQNKHIDLFFNVKKYSLSGHRIGKEKLYNYILRWSSFKRNHKIIKLLLKKDNIKFSENVLNQTFSISASAGYFKVIKLFLDNKKILISFETIKKALITAIKNDKNNRNYEVVNLLVTKYLNSIDNNLMEESLILAVQSGSNKIVKLFMANNTKNPASIQLTEAITKAANAGYFKTLKVLMKNENIDFPNIDLNALEFKYHFKHEIKKYELLFRDFPNVVLNDASFYEKFLDDYEKVFHLLFSKNKINYSLNTLIDCYESILIFDYENNILKFLINKKLNFTPIKNDKNKFIISFFIMSIMNGDGRMQTIHGIEDRACDSIGEYFMHLICCLRQAARSAHMKVVKLLFENEFTGVSFDELNLLFQKAEDQGRIAFLKTLVNFHKINLTLETLENIYKNVEKESKIKQCIKNEIRNLLCEYFFE